MQNKLSGQMGGGLQGGQAVREPPNTSQVLRVALRAPVVAPEAQAVQTRVEDHGRGLQCKGKGKGTGLGWGMEVL